MKVSSLKNNVYIIASKDEKMRMMVITMNIFKCCWLYKQAHVHAHTLKHTHRHTHKNTHSNTHARAHTHTLQKHTHHYTHTNQTIYHRLKMNIPLCITEFASCRHIWCFLNTQRTFIRLDLPAPRRSTSCCLSSGSQLCSSPLSTAMSLSHV